MSTTTTTMRRERFCRCSKVGGKEGVEGGLKGISKGISRGVEGEKRSIRNLSVQGGVRSERESRGVKWY